jgi:glycosyltransferase involved in cell wall biosynthesis
MKLSVIIPCYNAADTLGTQLEALANQEWSGLWEVIIADNGSTDETVAIAKTYNDRLPGLRVIDASSRQGAAAARNIGAQAATGDALLFCDADDEVSAGWVAAMGKALSDHDFVASRWDTAKYNAPWVQKSRGNPQQDSIQRYTYPPYLPHAGGSGLGIKRSVYEAVGGYDESMHRLEDTDFCWRAQLAGVELKFAPDALVHIRYPQTLSGLYCQARGYAEYNVLLYEKYRPHGMPELPWQESLNRWIRLLRWLGRIHSPVSRGCFAWQLGARIGRLQGSIKHRVWAL